MAKIFKPTEENLRDLRKFLRLGQLVAIPTETVYGLAANALDQAACSKIFEVKERPSNDPLICHVASYDSLEAICETNESARKLAEAFWPGPLTFVLPKRPCIPDIVTAGLPSVGVRSPSHPVFRQLIEDCDFPLAAPSANPFAYISPTMARHVQANLGQRIEYILDGGPCEYGVESTILDLRNPEDVRILRYGALPIEPIENVLKRRLVRPEPNPDHNAVSIAPGSLPKHYSPRTPLDLRRTPVREDELSNSDRDIAFLLLRKPLHTLNPNIHWLSERGELEAIASNLYAKLRELDSARYTKIVAEEAPELGLGLAINDRLRRASFK
ncbi:MAG: threonylcarbamoyl-AMP synthase [Opitutales bacterium TMED158]|nr:MAG: threonylcarbamoyl-AMP synthase [Opitutales bacterium TMED158]